METYQNDRREERSYSAGKMMILGLVSAVMILCLMIGITRMNSISQNKTAETLEDAIVQASVHCYAVEGVYPESLDYLKEHYGISYDDEKYVVKYEVIAQNIRPQIHVITLE